jgi:hypothetical protein
MMAKPKNLEHNPDDKEQFNRFVETARKLECDEDKERFEKSLGKIAAYKPPKAKANEAKFEKKLAKIAVQQTIRGKATAPKARRKP